MAKLQTLFTLLPFLFFSSITATATAAATLGRRGLTATCFPLLGVCTNHFPSGNFFRHPSPSLLFPSPSSVVVPSPPPVFTNPYYSAPSNYYTNPSFSPLVASPPPPGTFINNPPVFPELPPAYGGINRFPPANGNLPPIVGKNQPDVFMSPPQQNWPAPDNNLPPIVGKLPQQQPQEVVVPPAVGGDARTGPRLPPVVQSPPAA